MLIKPRINNIGTFNYLKTIFLGKGFEIYSISSETKLADDYERSVTYDLEPSEKGMISISKGFIILTYVKPDGKRVPIFVKRCELVNDDEGGDLLEVLGIQADTKNSVYMDQDGWKWSLHIPKSEYARSVSGRGFILVSKEDSELYNIRFR